PEAGAAATSPPGFVSGTRLKGRYYDVGGGMKDLVAWHDTKLDIDCDFNSLGGICFPSEHAGFEAPFDYFSDAACSVGVASAIVELAPYLQYALGNSGGTCGGMPHVRRLGAAYGGTVYSPRNGVCTPEEDPRTNLAFYELGEPVSIDEFVH